MAIFISYSHQDKAFVTNLAQMLVAARHNIWIDQWELNAGDSIIEKVQDAVGEADALLVILSSSSVSSEWCKKELRTALHREINEAKTLVIPCIIDDCKIPLFLQEKMYVDFRTDKGQAFALLDRSLSKISNPRQSRIERQDFHTDWSLDWGDIEGTPCCEWTFVDHGPNSPYSVLTRIRLLLDDLNYSDFKKMIEANTQISFVSERLLDFLENEKEGVFRLRITDANEVSETMQFTYGGNKKATIFVGSRRLGEDNGMDTIFSVDNIIRQAVGHSLGVVKQSNP